MHINLRWKANTLKRHRYTKKVWRTNLTMYRIIRRIKLTKGATSCNI